MDAECTVEEHVVMGWERADSEVIDGGGEDGGGDGAAVAGLKAKYTSTMEANGEKIKSMQVHELSRLWLYTNGKKAVN